MDKAIVNKRRMLSLALSIGALVMMTGCAEVRAAKPDPLRSEVQQLVSGLERGLRAGGWSAVERYYSDDFRGNTSDLQDHFDDRRRNERSADWMLTINRILSQDKLINVAVRWNHRWTDAKGLPHKSDGVSELILRREAGELRIVQQSGAGF